MTEKPRIGIYVINFPRSSETFIVTKVLGLLDRGFDVTIFCAAKGGDWDKFQILQNRADVRQRIVYSPRRPSKVGSAIATVKLLAEKAISQPRQLLHLLTSSWRNREQLPMPFWANISQGALFIGHKLDILHIEFDVQGLSIVGVKPVLGCKILLSSRGEHHRSTLVDNYPQGMKTLFQYADGYHFISEYLHRSTLDAGLPPQLPTWLISPAIDLSLFQPVNRTGGDKSKGDVFTIIAVGRLTWAKGYEFALDAIKLLKQQGFRFQYIVLGDGPYEDAILFAARQLGLLEADAVKFVGHVSREKVVEYYTRADVMLHAALEEGFCNAVIEAQAMEIPVVATDSGGLPENIEDGVTGFVVPRRNAKVMAEKLEQLLSDPDLRRTMGKAGRERALKLYNIEDQVESFAKLYQELASS